jgi:uncharacterized protein (DUF1697 family)
MTTYVALLRGINVGGGNKISMAKLKTCIENIGYGNVRTYINSGNVIFTDKSGNAGRIAEQISKCIHKNFSFKIDVVVRTDIQMQSLVKKIPKAWSNNDEMKTDIIFLRDEIDDPKVLSLIKTTPGVDNLIYTKGAVIWNLDRKHYGKSGMQKFIGTHVYKNMTARNVNTARKLCELMKLKG